MEIDLCTRDTARIANSGGARPAAEICLDELPRGLYVKVDKCDHEFLPPRVCPEHEKSGFSKGCSKCRAFEGWVLVQPLCRSWTFSDPLTGATLSMRRTQLPLMPEPACPLYSLQGATCDPGLIAHFAMPKRLDHDIKWLIVYVLLSRVRRLSNLRSVGLSDQVRAIIEGGPPALLAENFEKLFRGKITETRKAAEKCKVALGWT